MSGEILTLAPLQLSTLRCASPHEVKDPRRQKVLQGGPKAVHALGSVREGDVVLG